MQEDCIKVDSDYDKFLNVGLFSKELSDTFYSISKKGNIFYVKLNACGLLLKPHTSNGGQKDHLIHIRDIIGGRYVWIQKPTRSGYIGSCGACTSYIIEKQKRNEGNELAYLYIFAYVLKKNRRHTMRRERTVITLRFCTYDNHEDNLREAQKWYMTLKSFKNNHMGLRNVMRDEPHKRAQKSEAKRLLILLNPKSGSGKTQELFEHIVVNILNEAEITYDLYVTSHSNFASNFVHHKCLSNWNGIVAVGGDGLFHEILNGLLKRKDWESVLNNLKLGIVPCGSGNGLARSIAHYFREPYEPKPVLGASLSLVSGKVALMNIVEIEQHSKITFSFLSIGWGLISDIDVESEPLRSIGCQRFIIWTLHRLINLRTYRGRISYLPKRNLEQRYVRESVNMNFPPSMSYNTFPFSNGFKGHTIPNIDDVEFTDIKSFETVTNQYSHSRCNSLSSASRVSTYYSIAESIYGSVASNSDYLETDLERADEIYATRLCQLNGNIIPSLRDSLPDTWSIEEGEFVMVRAAFQTHLGSDCYFSPQSRLNDGIMYLVIIRGGISRSQLLSFLINMSSGTHLPNENTDFIKVERVEAFRLEPRDNNGVLTVDGERIECESFQATIFPGTINVMVPDKVEFNDQ